MWEIPCTFHAFLLNPKAKTSKTTARTRSSKVHAHAGMYTSCYLASQVYIWWVFRLSICPLICFFFFPFYRTRRFQVKRSPHVSHCWWRWWRIGNPLSQPGHSGKETGHWNDKCRGVKSSRVPWKTKSVASSYIRAVYMTCEVCCCKLGYNLAQTLTASLHYMLGREWLAITNTIHISFFYPLAV